MLRLQQFERLMKTLEAQRAANLEKVSDKTLGTLVKSLFESYAVPDGFERELLPEDKVPTDRISMAISYRMTMAPERLAEVRAQIEELVVMRNELVHHFIERFDLWSDLGCEAALRHLEHCYQRIDHHHNELVGWAKTMDEARAYMAAFAETDAFHDMVVNGIRRRHNGPWPLKSLRGEAKTFEYRLSMEPVRRPDAPIPLQKASWYSRTEAHRFFSSGQNFNPLPTSPDYKARFDELLAGYGSNEADELAADLEALVAEVPDATERDALVKARIGQGKFRAGVVASWRKGETCALTGLAVPEMLIASHIKPWRESSNAERLARLRRTADAFVTQVVDAQVLDASGLADALPCRQQLFQADIEHQVAGTRQLLQQRQNVAAHGELARATLTWKVSSDWAISGVRPQYCSDSV